MSDTPVFDLGLAGKTVLVTGGSRGIGRSIAKAFLDAGATVRITARDAAKLEPAAADLGERCSWAVADVSNEEAARSAVQSMLEDLGAIDVLVNNAGMGLRLARLVELDAARAAKAALVNQWAPVLWARLVWEAWQSAHGGAIVNIASLGGLAVWPNGAYYGATKAALIHLTRHLALEFAPDVRVNAVAPGRVDTDMSRGADDPAGGPPSHRLGRPDEVADIVVFLASSRASLISGATVVAAHPASLITPGAQSDDEPASAANPQVPHELNDQDVQRLTRLVTEIVWRIDHGRADSVHELFVDDGELNLGGDVIRGKEAMQEWGRARAAADRCTRHVCTNQRFEPYGNDGARGTVTVTVFLHDGPGTAAATPFVVGEYHDEFTRRDCEWRFVSRRLESLFVRDA